MGQVSVPLDILLGQARRGRQERGSSVAVSLLQGPQGPPLPSAGCQLGTTPRLPGWERLACGPRHGGDAEGVEFGPCRAPCLIGFTLTGLNKPLSAASSTTGMVNTSGQPYRTSTALAPSAGSVGMMSCIPTGTGTSPVRPSSAALSQPLSDVPWGSQEAPPPPPLARTKFPGPPRKPVIGTVQ